MKSGFWETEGKMFSESGNEVVGFLVRTEWTHIRDSHWQFELNIYRLQGKERTNIESSSIALEYVLAKANELRKQGDTHRREIFKLHSYAVETLNG